MKADLHIHSLYSDGIHSVDDILVMAKDRGLDVISITDHDNYDGVINANPNAGIKVILGLELTTTFNNEAVHLLGYFKSKEHLRKLKPLLDEQITARKVRAKAILEKLETLGIILDPSFISEKNGISRGTIALEIIKQGYNYTMTSVFEELLGVGCPAYISVNKTETSIGIKAIKDARGLAVLAHPMLLKVVDPVDIIKLGIDGIEVKYPHYLDLESFYRKKAYQHGLFITGGSDFHFLDDWKHGNIGDVFIEGKDLDIFLGKTNEC